LYQQYIFIITSNENVEIQKIISQGQQYIQQLQQLKFEIQNKEIVSQIIRLDLVVVVKIM